MPKFISDDDMLKLEATAPKKKVISDDEMAALESSQPSKLESAVRGAAQGASLGFSDELTGAAEAAMDWAKSNPGSFWENYKKHRDESRANYAQAEEANPMSYGAGQVGGSLATAFVPGLNAAKGASLATAAGKAALQGGIAGAGLSNAESVGDLAKDAAEGAALGGAIGGTLHGGVQLAAKYGDEIKQAVPKVLGKAGSYATGIDEDALARQYLRPGQSAAAEAEGFSHDLSQRVGNEIDARSQYLGENVHRAGNEFKKDFGTQSFQGDGEAIANSIGDFLYANEQSPMGFTALKTDQVRELENLQKILATGHATGDDLFKLRQYMDQAEQLAGKYDKEGSSLFVRKLKEIRHQADQAIDAADPRLDRANKAYAQHQGDRDLLRGAENEKTGEAFINNLYDGANKTAKQQAADRVLGVQPELLEEAKDIAANKAFKKQGPAGSDPGFRNMVKIAGIGGVFGSGGATGIVPVLMSPTAWKYGLRGLGKVGQKLGKYGPVLEKAAQRGGNSLAATHFILQQTDPDYKNTMDRLEQDNE